MHKVSKKEERGKKKPGRQSYRSLPHTGLPPLPQQHCCGEARPWQLCHRASCCVHISWNLSLTQPWLSALMSHSNVAFTMFKTRAQLLHQSSIFSSESMLKSLLILKVFPFILANFSQDCKQIKKIKLLFLNIKSNFIYITILHCYCMDKCEMCYIIKVRILKCTII